MRRTPLLARRFLLLASLLASLVVTAADIEVLNVNLDSLIERSATHRERFAVNVPHRVSTATHGAWASSGGESTWSYAIRIPTAVSMSFHADLARLPASARIRVGAGKSSAQYRAKNVNRDALWGRPVVGDTLEFTLTVNDAEKSAVRFEIDSLQAGYRGLGGRVPDHPKFKSLQPNSAATAAECIENYNCNATAANIGPAYATVAVLIGNVAQCTGTLLNNTREDGTPYVLTARHCQNGELGGGDPGIANSVTIYWNAVSACGTVLGSLYDSATEAQSGAVTLFEQQDAWLIRLDNPPLIATPYYAGWDATGATWVGGYSIHHAMGFNKRYTGWHGQAILQRIPGATLDVGYDSDYWGLVNAVGNVGAGASGGAVFDANDRVVGNASLAYLINGAGSEGVCPTTPPPAPTRTTITAQYTALSAIYNSTSDTTSQTGSVTLRTILDPGGTGQLVQNGLGIMPVTLTASVQQEVVDEPVTLSWSAPWAQSCIATGGRAGDGWAGSLTAIGSRPVSSSVGDQLQYTLSCSGGDKRGRATVAVNWLFVPAAVSLQGPTGSVAIGTSFALGWNSNVQPCVASDGNSGDGWAGSKSRSGNQTLPANRLGATTYSITCGTGARVASTQVTVQVVPLFVDLRADATRLRVGAAFNIYWSGNLEGSPCNGSGGVPSWAQNTQQVQSGGSAMSTSQVPGVFTYTLTCSAGAQTVSSSFTIAFVNEPASQSLVAVAPRQAIFPLGTPPGTGPANLLWTSNRAFCNLISLGPMTNTASVELKGQYPAGTASAVATIAGIYTYELNCFGTISTATIEWFTPDPYVTISELSGASTWVGGYPYRLQFAANTLPCVRSGGVPGDGWLEDAVQITAPRTPGNYTYSLTCGAGTSIARDDFVVTVPVPAVTLTATPANPSTLGQATLRWESNAYPCAANADGAGVAWGSSSMNYVGQAGNSQTSPGTYTYTIRCGAGANTASASTQVPFRDGPTTSLLASVSTTTVNEPVTLTWISDGTNCEAGGGTFGDGWSGLKPSGGTVTLTSRYARVVSYILNCGNGGAVVNITYNAVAGSDPGTKPRATLQASRTAQTAGQTVTLTWTSENADGCFASGGSSGDGWSGSLSLSGSMAVTRSSAGSTVYSLTCTGATPASTAQTTVTYSAAPGNNGGGGNSGGGGGGLDRLTALALLALMMMQLDRRRVRRSR